MRAASGAECEAMRLVVEQAAHHGGPLGWIPRTQQQPAGPDRLRESPDAGRDDGRATRGGLERHETERLPERWHEHHRGEREQVGNLVAVDRAEHSHIAADPEILREQGQDFAHSSCPASGPPATASSGAQPRIACSSASAEIARSCPFRGAMRPAITTTGRSGSSPKSRRTSGSVSRGENRSRSTPGGTIQVRSAGVASSSIRWPASAADAAITASAWPARCGGPRAAGLAEGLHERDPELDRGGQGGDSAGHVVRVHDIHWGRSDQLGESLTEVVVRAGWQEVERDAGQQRRRRCGLPAGDEVHAHVADRRAPPRGPA